MKLYKLRYYIPNNLVPAGIIIYLLAMAFGWTLNLIKFTECDFKSPYEKEIIHTVGLTCCLSGMVNKRAWECRRHTFA